jgi:FkbM family methyltransferase
MRSLTTLIIKGLKNPQNIPSYIKQKCTQYVPEIFIIRKWKGGWKYILHQYGVIDEPFQIALRSQSPTFYANWKDRDVIEEFYQNDGYEDIDLTSCETVIDVGAHIGLFTLQANKAGATVYAFEPSSDSYINFLLNVKLHTEDDSNIIPNNAAVTSTDGFCEFTQNEDLSLCDSTVVNGSDERKRVASLSFSTVSEQIDKRGKTLLKLDCEGAEFEILQSSSAEDFAGIDTVFLEYHGRAGDPAQLEELLRDYDYTVTQRPDPRDLDAYDLGFILAQKELE